MKTLRKINISFEVGYAFGLLSEKPQRGRNLRDNHSQRQEVHAYGVGYSVIHNIDVLAKTVRDSSEGSSVEKGHGCAEYSSNGSMQHRLASFCSKDGYSKREQEHEDGLADTKSGVSTDVRAFGIAKFVGSPIGEP